MKVIELRTENFKRIEAVEVRPGDRALVMVCGNNAQGKSSLLDALWGALASRLPEKPIREGADKADIEVILGDGETIKLCIHKTITPDRAYLTVTDGDGARIKTPQAILDTLYSGFTFDPEAFVRLKPREQVDALMRVCGVEDQMVKLETERLHVFDQRTMINRDLKSAEARLTAASKGLPEECPAEIDVVELTEKRKVLDQSLRKRVAHDSQIKLQARTVDDLTARAGQLQAEIDRKQSDMQELLAAANAEAERLTALKEIVLPTVELLQSEVDKLDEQISQSESVNRLVQQFDQANTLSLSVAEQQGKSDSLTRKLDRIDKQKADLVGAANLAVPGLSFDSSQVYYNGVPIQDCAASERLRIGVMLGMKAHPELRILRIEHGSLLDEDNRKMLAEMAEIEDFQFWVESVGEHAECGIIIEAGKIKESK